MKISHMVLVASISILGWGLAGRWTPAAYGAPSCDPAVVDAARAEIAATCPCAGKTNPAGEVVPWKNHGQYVSCVTRTRNSLAKNLDISKSCLRRVTPCGARSTCGKPGFATCRTPDECSDTVADGVAEGTCADDPSVICDTAADCPAIRCSIKHSADLCEAMGGIPGTGSCCDE